jgi:hypothetical protein
MCGAEVKTVPAAYFGGRGAAADVQEVPALAAESEATARDLFEHINSLATSRSHMSTHNVTYRGAGGRVARVLSKQAHATMID